MTRKALFFNAVYDRLFAVYGECGCPLVHATPFQLLAAVMLSAQCRDDRVNEVTRELFSLAPDAASMAKLPVEKIADVIHSLGLYAAKARNLQCAAQRIVDVYHGEVPQTMEDLTSLSGIGRKSANVVLGNAFGIPGFPVDTHVNRVLNRLGAVAADAPEAIEKIVNREVKPEKWSNFSHLLIQHGRHTCDARKPQCEACVLADMCSHRRKSR